MSFAEVFASAAVKSLELWQRTTGQDGHPAEDAIAKIPLTDLKSRILRQLGRPTKSPLKLFLSMTAKCGDRFSVKIMLKRTI